MKLEIKLDKSLEEALCIIMTPEITDEIKKLTDYIHSSKADIIVGMDIDKLEVIEQANLIRIYAQDKKVYGETTGKTYTLKLPLYEVEKRLGSSFIRISNSEIINVRKIKGIDMDFVGTISLELDNGHSSYCSRRYVPIIRKKLGI